MFIVKFSRDIMPSYYQFITSVIYLKQVWDPAVMPVNILVAVYRHQKFALQRPEQHAMSEIGWGNRFFLLYPRPFQCTT